MGISDWEKRKRKPVPINADLVISSRTLQWIALFTIRGEGVAFLRLMMSVALSYWGSISRGRRAPQKEAILI
jgi:hypothetical protein